MKLVNPTDDPELRVPFGDIVPIPGMPGYTISRKGVVWRNFFRNRHVNRTFNPPVRMAIRSSNTGYPRVSLTINGVQKTFWLHQLVLLAFVGNRPAGFVARHKNGVKVDCCADNLEWSTPRKNYDDMVEHGTVTAGTRNGNALLRDSQVTEMRRLRALGAPTRELAKKYGVSHACIQKVCNKTMWRHLP